MSNVSACDFHVNGQYVEVSKCAMYLVKYAKRSFGISFNIFRAGFGNISSRHKNVLFHKYCVLYGSPLWPLVGTMIQSVCVDWRKALRCVWSVNNRTGCDIITSLCNHMYFVF